MWTLPVPQSQGPYTEHGVQMILDKQFEGTLDQGAGCLEIFDAPKPDTVYPEALSTISSMSAVVDTLFTRSQKVVALLASALLLLLCTGEGHRGQL